MLLCSGEDCCGVACVEFGTDFFRAEIEIQNFRKLISIATISRNEIKVENIIMDMDGIPRCAACPSVFANTALS